MADHDPPAPESAAAAATGITPTPSAAGQTAILQLLARAVGIISVVVGTAMVTRRLGTDFADWASVIVLVSLTGVLLEPGLAPVVAKRLTIDHEHAPTPAAMFPVRLALGMVSWAVVVALAVVTRGPDVWLLAVLLGGQVVARSVFNNATSWLQVDQRLYRLAALEAAAAVLGLAGLALALVLDAPTPVLGAMAFTVPLVLIACLVPRELRRTPATRLPSPGAQWPKVRSVLVETLPLAGAIGLAAIYTRTSVYFVNRYEDDASASRFLFAFLFAEQSIAFAGIVAGAVLPLLAARTRIAHLISDDVTQRLLVAISAVGALACAALIAGSELLTVVIGGPELAGAETFIQLVAPMVAVILPAMVLAYVFISLGLGRRYFGFAVVGLAANLILSLLFVPTYGALASARITWATELLVTLLPLSLVLMSGRAGRRAVLVITLLLGLSVLASELSGRSVVNHWIAGLGLVVAVVACAHGSLRWLVRETFRR